ncbi:hypothetical protein [Bosea sp. 2RAB26]|uniref:hypothetical protein n=1 Tax=Bosea sp. 2RAB26 TaxID=3237476 RepID=UPI003F8DB95C
MPTLYHHRCSIRAGRSIGARAGIVALLLVAGWAAKANDDGAYSPRFPIPKPILTHEEPEDAVEPQAQEAQDDLDAVPFDPALSARANWPAPPKANRQLPREIPLSVIRQGFSTRGPTESAPERSVGLQLGADTFSISTKLIAPPGHEQVGDARIDWKLARPVANKGPGFIWTISTGGGSSTAGKPEQNASLLVGFRHQLFQYLTMSSQLSMAGSYVFAPDGGPHSTLVPEVKLSADLAALANLSWEASLDLALARQMPLVASQYETRGTALLRLKYSLE